MGNSAARFYERNHQWHLRQPVAEGGGDPLAALGRPGTRYAAAVAHLTENPGCSVVELGCGNPAVPRALAPLVASYTAIDIVADRLAGDDLPGLRTICADLDEDFPLPDACCDVLLAMMVVEHLYDPFHAFAEIARLVRPGGTAFVNLPNIASIRCRLDLLRGRLPNTSAPDWFERREWDGSHLHYFTVDSVRRLARHSGFELAAMHPVGRMTAFKRLRPHLLCHEITFVLDRAEP